MQQHINTIQHTLAKQQTLMEYQRERFMAQAQFAEFLCGRHPEQADSWRDLIAQATDRVASAAAGSVEKLAEAVQQAELLMTPIGKTAKQYSIYCVGHAHIDMNWMWSWPETVATTNDTFTTVLRMMEEFPQFHFSQSQASVYRIVEQQNPKQLERIADRVAEGRWEVTASHWVEGDKNMTSGESLCRHLLYTRAYMQELFGLSPEDIQIDWAPDTFGHAHTVPTYLVRGGIRYAYMHRPGVHTDPQPRPGAFWWRGPDGSQVLVRNDMRLGYNGQIGPHIVSASLLPFVQETGLPFTMFVYGVGDHGGGPTRRDLVRLADIRTWPIFPEIRAARACEFFQRLEQEGADLPVIDDELNFEFSGCYTTETLIKKANRFAEKKLVDAEAANTFAWASGLREYPTARFEQSWRDTLFSHFHDILPGSGVHDTRTYTHGLYQQTVAMTGVQEAEALRAIAERVDTSSATTTVEETLPSSRYPTAMGGGIGYQSANGNVSQYGYGKGSDNRPLLVFNPLPDARSEIVEAIIWDSAWGWQLRDPNSILFAVTAPDGTCIAAQRIETGHYWGHQFVKLAFPVNVPGLGYALYTVSEGSGLTPLQPAHLTGLTHQCGYSSYERSPEGLENEHLRVDFDLRTGGIQRLTDQQTGIALVDGAEPAALLEYGIERNRSMNAWLIEHTNGWRNLHLVALRRGLNGPYKATMDAVLRVEQSEFTLTYELRAGDPNLYLHLRGTWFQRGTGEGVPVLRFSVPVALDSPEAEYEIPFGAIQRKMAHGEEVPALRWAAVTGQQNGRRAGLLLLNDSKHGHALDGNRLCLTLIRSSTNPDPLPEIGEHEIHLALAPLSDTSGVPEAIQRGRAFNHELKVISTDAHPGDFPIEASFVQVDSATVVLDAIKKAEQEDALVLRLYQPVEGDTTCQIRLNEELLGQVTEVRTVDLMERPTGDDPIPVTDGTFDVLVPSHGIQSVLVQIGR